MAKGQKTKSYKAKEKSEVIKCNVLKGCKNHATFDFIMATPTDNIAKEYRGCDKCILTLQKEHNAVLLDGTK